METSELQNSFDEEDVTPVKNNYRNLLDSDSEEESAAENNVEVLEQEQASKHSSKSSSDSERENEEHTNRRKNKFPKKKIIPAKTQRKSAAKAMTVIKEKMSYKQEAELKQKIQSEKQRMEREQEISVPYHKPKQYTLKEFLARKTIKRPESIKQGDAPANSIIALKNLRGEELEKFAQQLKEREEEALEFFKSESESEEDDGDKSVETKEKEAIDLVTTSTVDEKNADGQIASSTEVLEEQFEENDENNYNKENTGCNIIPSTNEANEQTLNNREVDVVAAVEHSDIKGTDDEINRLRIKYKDVIVENAASKFSTLKTLKDMGPNDVINLDTGLIQPRQLSGPENLFQRYLKNVQKPQPKDSVCMSILTVENGKIEQQQIEVKLNKEAEFDHDRPGLSREKLKQELLNKILMKRRDEIKSKQLDIKTAESEPDDKSENLEKSEAVEELINQKHMSEESSSDEEDVEEEEEDEEMIEKKEKRVTGCPFLEDQAIDEDASDLESEESSSSSEEETEVSTTKKGRILKAFVDSDDEESSPRKIVSNKAEELSQINSSEVISQPRNTETELFTSQEEVGRQEFSEPSDVTFNEPSVSEEITTNGIKDLCDSGPSQIDDDDFLDILSGRFIETQDTLSTKALESVTPLEDNFSDSQFVSQVPETIDANAQLVQKTHSPTNDEVDASQLVPQLDSCQKTEIHQRKIFDSSEDEDENPQSGSKLKRKNKKKLKQKLKKLEFSDDEEHESSNPDDFEEIDELEECEKEEEEEREEVLVDYDSEENEVEVVMKKKDIIKSANNYFEQEAELSESEWGSADEDEKGLDKYDIEVADEEQFDQNKLQEEVGRIHARKMLDDDIRNVKKIEDLLFESEENDGVGRERKFRWANQKSFTLEDDNARDGDVLQESDSDGENEIMWRKMRHERETMLQQKMSEGDTVADEIVFLDPNSQTITTSNSILLPKKKFKIIKSTSAMETSINSIDASKRNSIFLIKSASACKFQNSFLSRGEPTLNRIAKFISHKEDEVTNLSHGSNSMSFTTIDKPEDSKKRKSEGSKLQEPSKKQKIDKNRKSLLDVLK